MYRSAGLSDPRKVGVQRRAAAEGSCTGRWVAFPARCRAGCSIRQSGSCAGEFLAAGRDAGLAGLGAAGKGVKDVTTMKRSRGLTIDRSGQNQNDDGGLFEMANLFSKHTGLPFVVWISYRGAARHDVRVKV